jgi:tetratricopeptide (TPR) repeat protein
VRKAIEYYEQALTLMREVGDKASEGMALGALGSAHQALGEVSKAIEYYEQALTIARAVGDKSREGAWLGSLGQIFAESGNYEHGIEALRQSLLIADEIQEPRLKSFTGKELAQAHLLHGDLTAAQQAIEAARQHDAPENNHNAAVLHGVIVLQAADTGLAQTIFNEAVTFADVLLKQPQGIYTARYARALAQAGLVLITNSPIDDARADYEAALGQCDAKGVVQRELRLLEELAKAPNGERLEPLIALLKERL